MCTYTHSPTTLIPARSSLVHNKSLALIFRLLFRLGLLLRLLSRRARLQKKKFG